MLVTVAAAVRLSECQGQKHQENSRYEGKIERHLYGLSHSFQAQPDDVYLTKAANASPLDRVAIVLFGAVCGTYFR